MSLINLGGGHHLPSILQAEAAECGIACMAMVATWHGYQCSLFTMRQRFGSSSRGATLQSLMGFADALELTPRALRIELKELKSLSLPAILHWNFNHFVVLKSINRNKVIIHDPAVGIRTYSLEEVGQRFTGIALELNPRSTFGASIDKNEPKNVLKIWDFWRGAVGLKSSLVQILILSLLIQAFALTTPFYMQLVVDEVLVKHDAELLLVLGLGFSGLMFISVITKAIRGYSSIYLSMQLSFNLGNSVMHHLIRLPLAYFEKRHLGDVISRFESLRPIQGFITSSAISVLIDGLLAMTTLGMMLAYSPLLTVIVIISVLLYGVFRAVQFLPLRNCNHENISATAKLDSLFMESIRSLQSIKIAGKESQRELTWRNQFVESINSGAKIGRLTVGYEAANSTLTGLEYVVLIFLGASQVLEGVLTVGMLYAFMAYRSHFSGSITSIVNQVMQYKMVGLHLERLSDITHTELEEGLQTEGKFTVPIQGSMSFHNLTFSYSGDSEVVFENLSFNVPIGGFTALYGPSGIGKSTLLKVMMGLVSPTQGKAMVDGQNIDRLGLRSYRKAISAVTQEDGLFSGSLKDNITFFDLQANEERIIEVAKLACIHEDILNMPMSYESLIGDMGTALSQGQQQRLLIARSLYSSPKILFLDEGTAHLDATTEKKIMQEIKKSGVTCIYVTHNPSILSFADQVIHWRPSGKVDVISREKKRAMKKVIA
ncbi:MAG: ATP-binding cassette subfamily B protein RaxB [Flavobacterium sp.]|jgi:ATP-binding cassette subfamily B protein RaxB